MAPRQRSLRTELLVSLGFVTSAAVLLVGITTVLLLGGDVHAALGPLIGLWFGSTVVFALFGAHVVHRLVIQPLRVLTAEADVLSVGGRRSITWLQERKNKLHKKALDVAAN